MKELQQRLLSLEYQNLKISNEIAEIKKQLEAPVKEERWRAEKGGGYFTIGIGVVKESVDFGWVSDDEKFNSFNYFQTREEADRIAKVQLAFRKLDWAIRKFEIETDIEENGLELYLNRKGVLKADYYTGKQYCLPRLKNQSDAEYIIQNYQPELLTFLTGGIQ